MRANGGVVCLPRIFAYKPGGLSAPPDPPEDIFEQMKGRRGAFLGVRGLGSGFAVLFGAQGQPDQGCTRED